MKALSRSVEVTFDVNVKAAALTEADSEPLVNCWGKGHTNGNGDTVAALMSRRNSLESVCCLSDDEQLPEQEMSTLIGGRGREEVK